MMLARGKSGSIQEEEEEREGTHNKIEDEESNMEDREEETFNNQHQRPQKN